MTTTFETAKVGDKVWGMRRGWGEIHSIDTDTGYNYPVAVLFPKEGRLSYTVDGLYHKDDITQSLFWDEVVIEAPQKPMPVLEVDTKVLVWYDNMPKYKRYFSHFSSSGRVVCFDHGLTSWTAIETSEWDNWELAEQISNEAKPLTTEELKAGGWWCAEVTEECAKVFTVKGLRVFKPSRWNDEAIVFYKMDIDKNIVVKHFSVGVTRVSKQIHRIGIEFYWS